MSKIPKKSAMKRPVNLRLDMALADRLATHAFATGTTMSELIEAFIRAEIPSYEITEKERAS